MSFHVDWPDGSISGRTVEFGDPIVVYPLGSGPVSSGLLVIEDDHVPVLDDATVSFVLEPQPDGSVDMVFRWQLDSGSDVSLDQVVLTDPTSGSSCLSSSPIILTPDMPDVEHSVVAKPGGGNTHTLRWVGQTCMPRCLFKYTVKSGVSASSSGLPTVTVSSPEHSASIPFCVQ